MPFPILPYVRFWHLITALFISLWIGPESDQTSSNFKIWAEVRNDGPESHFAKKVRQPWVV